MTAWVLAGWILMAAAVFGAVSILFLLFSGRARLSKNPAEIGYSPSRYRPMARLVSQQDFGFLQSRPGYVPAIGKRYAKSKKRVLRMYIRQLRQDFRQLHAEARLLLASRDASASDTNLVWTLLRQRAEFEGKMALLEFRLLLGPVGFQLPTIEPLLEMMDTMQLSLSDLNSSQVA